MSNDRSKRGTPAFIIGQLAREDRDVFRFDLLARPHAALLYLGDKDALASQCRLHLIFTASAGFAPNDLAVAILAFPIRRRTL